MIRPLSKCALLGKIDHFWTGLKMNFEVHVEAHD